MGSFHEASKKKRAARSLLLMVCHMYLLSQLIQTCCTVIKPFESECASGHPISKESLPVFKLLCGAKGSKISHFLTP